MIHWVQPPHSWSEICGAKGTREKKENWKENRRRNPSFSGVSFHRRTFRHRGKRQTKACPVGMRVTGGEKHAFISEGPKGKHFFNKNRIKLLINIMVLFIGLRRRNEESCVQRGDVGARSWLKLGKKTTKTRNSISLTSCWCCGTKKSTQKSNWKDNEERVLRLFWQQRAEQSGLSLMDLAELLAWDSATSRLLSN